MLLNYDKVGSTLVHDLHDVLPVLEVVLNIKGCDGQRLALAPVLEVDDIVLEGSHVIAPPTNGRLIVRWHHFGFDAHV